MRAPALLLALAAVTAGCLGLPDTGDPEVPPPGVAFARACFAPVEGWPDPCTTLASPNESPSKTEIDLVINPTDPRNVFVASKDLDAKASDCVWSVGQVTKDGGATWKTVYVGGERGMGRHPLLQPFACVTDPIMAFGKDGTLFYALQAYRLGVGPDVVPSLPLVGQQIVGSTFILARSTDGGETFDHFVAQHVGDGVAVFHDYPRMLTNPATGTVCAIWNGVGQAGITPWVSCTRDGGETVDRPVGFHSQDGPRSTSFESGFAATKDGTVYVTAAVFPTTELALQGSDTMDVRIFASTDDARSFREVAKAFEFQPTPRQLDTNDFRTPSFVEMAADATDGEFSGRLYVFYPDYGTGDSDVLSRFSDDGGVTWSEPVPIHSDRTNDQFMMRPTVGADGTVHVLFSDRRHDPENRLLDQYLAWSTDGGVTWQDARLTDTSFDGDLGVHQNGFPFIGDYNGIAVTPDGKEVWTAWGDTRTGVAEIAVARSVRSS